MHAQQKLLTVITAKADGGGGGVEATVDAASAKIAVSGRAATLADLQPGMTVFVPLGNGMKVAGLIEAFWPAIGGVVQSVDVPNNSLTLVVDQPQDGDRPKSPGTGRDKRPGQTFVLGKETQITVSGIPVLLGDLEPKTSYVTLDLAADGKTPTAVRAKVIQGCLHGYVTAIDAAKSTITIQLGGLNGPGAELTLDVAKDASILRHGKPDKLGELVLQSSALIKLGADKHSAVVIRTAFPRMQTGPEDR